MNYNSHRLVEVIASHSVPEQRSWVW